MIVRCPSSGVREWEWTLYFIFEVVRTAAMPSWMSNSSDGNLLHFSFTFMITQPRTLGISNDKPHAIVGCTAPIDDEIVIMNKAIQKSFKWYLISAHKSMLQLKHDIQSQTIIANCVCNWIIDCFYLYTTPLLLNGWPLRGAFKIKFQ